MVDDLEIAKRAQAAQQAAPLANPYTVPPVQPQGPLTVSDEVDLSAGARNIVNEVRHTQSIAEAWLRNKTETPDLTDPSSLRARKDPYAQISNGQDKEDKDVGQESLSDAFQAALTDIGWLVDALGVNKYDIDPVAEAVAAKAAAGGVGVRPPVSVIAAQAAQSGSSAALYLENLSITVQKGKTVDVSVDRVAITTVNSSVADSIKGAEKPLVVDVGGGLQDVGAKALGNSSTDDVAITPAARAEQASKTAEILLDSGVRSDDQRHALLIVREGGKVLPQGTLKLKLDVLQPIR